MLTATASIADLRAALVATRPALPRTKTDPGLDCVHVEAGGGRLTLTTTDNTTVVQTIIPAKVSGAGAGLVPHRQLAGILHGKGSIELSCGGDWLTATNGKVSRFPLGPIDDFPAIPEAGMFAGQYPLDMAAVRSVLHAAYPLTHWRPFLNGVLFQGTDVVATDTHRLAAATATHDLPTMIVPAATLRMVAKAVAATSRRPELPVSLLTPGGGDPVVQFRAGRTVWTTQLIADDYPNWRGVFPTGWAGEATIDRSSLMDGIDKVRQIIERPVDEPAILTIPTTGVAHLDVKNSVTGETREAAISMVDRTAPLEIAFNVGYLADAVTAAGGSGHLTIKYVNGSMPVEVTDQANPNSVRLLMPTRIPL